MCVCLGGGVANLFLAANKVLRLITDGGRRAETQQTTYVAHVCAKCFNFGSSIRHRRHFIINAGGKGGGAGWVICANCKDNRERVRAVIELAFVAGWLGGGKRQTKLEANFECLWPAAKCKSPTDRDSNRCWCGGRKKVGELQASVNFVAYFSARHAIKMQKSQRQQLCLPSAHPTGTVYSLLHQHPKTKDQNRCTPKLKRKYQAQTQSQTQTEA